MLTAKEQQVARLAAGGGSNRDIAAQLFLSVKTIEMHLGRAIANSASVPVPNSLT
ncbi:helix-turn-helix domain-containing protein [Rhodococcus jostii]|uniref:helix-turn-helix domain-containing protein n=1 Tax=Rhodococcus jostii TaxID=132919 RepID=UPI001F086F80|nr:helix-turn-helix transcriptional regulator [Rhodococcus jostii]